MTASTTKLALVSTLWYPNMTEAIFSLFTRSSSCYWRL